MYILYQRLLTTINEENFDTIEYHIARTLVQNIHYIDQIPIGQLANMCGVSKSSISKFVRNIGFEDFIDFKLEAQRQKEKDQYFPGSQTMNITDYMYKNGEKDYVEVLIKDIYSLFSIENYNAISSLVNDMYEHDDVAAFGEIYSETAALNLQYKMAFYRKFIYTTFNDQKQTEYIERAKEDSVILVFSNSGRYINYFSSKDGSPQKNTFNTTKARIYLVTSNKELLNDSKIHRCIFLTYSKKVQNHPILYQLLIELIALMYQKKYGFPKEFITLEK